MRTVGEVAKLAGVTIRTLHHYDEIGLLSPSGRSEAGYRLYSHKDLLRLQEILGWRALGFSLKDRSTQEETSMFDGLDPTKYDEEARERWGETDAYRESTGRTAGYGEREWSEIREQSDAIVVEFAALMSAGEPPDTLAARSVAERHREHISHWFYPCSPEMHRGLAQMYVADERFARNFERHASGLAVYVRDAIEASCGAERRLSP